MSQMSNSQVSSDASGPRFGAEPDCYVDDRQFDRQVDLLNHLCDLYFPDGIEAEAAAATQTVAPVDPAAPPSAPVQKPVAAVSARKLEQTRAARPAGVEKLDQGTAQSLALSTKRPASGTADAAFTESAKKRRTTSPATPPVTLLRHTQPRAVPTIVRQTTQSPVSMVLVPSPSADGGNVILTAYPASMISTQSPAAQNGLSPQGSVARPATAPGRPPIPAGPRRRPEIPAITSSRPRKSADARPRPKNHAGPSPAPMIAACPSSGPAIPTGTSPWSVMPMAYPTQYAGTRPVIRSPAPQNNVNLGYANRAMYPQQYRTPGPALQEYACQPRPIRAMPPSQAVPLTSHAANAYPYTLAAQPNSARPAAVHIAAHDPAFAVSAPSQTASPFMVKVPLARDANGCLIYGWVQQR